MDHRLKRGALAESGYSVLVVNPYYRTARGSIVAEGKTFHDPGIRELLMPHARSLSPATCLTDGRAFVAWLDQQAVVDSKRKIGTTGYCMTGSYAMRLAAAMPAPSTDGVRRTRLFTTKRRLNERGHDCWRCLNASWLCLILAIRDQASSNIPNPLLSTRLSIFRAIPLGFLVPLSHWRTVDVLVLRHFAKTG